MLAALTAAGSYPGTSPGTGAPGGRPAVLGGPGLCKGGGGPGCPRRPPDESLLAWLPADLLLPGPG